MKQYTTPEQTAKLIELGFEKPKNIVEGELYSDIYFAYSIGELIEMLPKVIDCDYDTYNLQIEARSNWKVCYVKNGMIEDSCDSSELIDALYNMIVKLKEEKVL
jgi:hypothetical protein